MVYNRRIVDDELDALFPHLAAITLEGPKAIGKTATASERAGTILHVDDRAIGDLLRVSFDQLDAMRKPILFDEWQTVPELWNYIKRRVDSDPRGGQYLLTGSATAVGDVDLHSGAGRIDVRRMRPLAFSERGIEHPTVRVADLLAGTAMPTGATHVDTVVYVEEILASGFPALRALAPGARKSRLDSYIARTVSRDYPEQDGRTLRRPESLRRWMAAYAAATATTSTMAQIARASRPGDTALPSRPTINRYRDVLTSLWILDPVPAWLPTHNAFKTLAQAEKHFLADPALAARLLNLNQSRLLDLRSPAELRPHDGTAIGALFEALVALSLRTYAQANNAEVFHYRSPKGEREIDFILVDDNGSHVAIEVKLSRTAEASHVKHLLWLKEQLGDDLADMVVVNTGPFAYRRNDGVAVVPLALLGH